MLNKNVTILFRDHASQAVTRGYKKVTGDDEMSQSADGAPGQAPPL